MINMKTKNRFFIVCVLMAFLLPAHSHTHALKKININVIDMELAEVMAMLSAKEQVNIMVNTGVTGKISLNLYQVSIDKVIRYAAAAGGYATEKKGGTYFIVKPDDVGARQKSDITDVKTYSIRYSDPEKVKNIIEEYISDYGKLTVLKDRRIIVLEDTPEYLKRVDRIIRDVDAAPKQILIEAKILEIALTDSDAYGINWSKVFDGGNNTVGSTLSTPASGLFFNRLTNSLDIELAALYTDDRVRTLSSPNLIAMENREASVIIGDRQGYKVTTTINQVTTESVEFLESGVILRVLPNIDVDGNILMEIHPEVSNGVISADGIPSQTTTEVTTDILTEDGQSIFIGGLIKNNIVESVDSVPVLGSIPLLGSFFSSNSSGNINTETVVVITPYIVGGEAYQEKARQQKLAFIKEEEKIAVASEESKVEVAETVSENELFDWEDEEF